MKYAILILTLLSAVTVSAQTSVKPEEQAKLKPLIEALNKANDTFTAKRDAMPETKAVAEAQAVLQKAVSTQQAAMQKLPEYEPVKVAEAKLLDQIYQVMADHKLSSREYRPVLTDKGELAFTRIEQPKSQ